MSKDGPDICVERDDAGDDYYQSALHPTARRFQPPAITYRSREKPGITLCAYASCHMTSSTTKLDNRQVS